MKRNRLSERDERLATIAAARLRGDGFKQKEIADILNISQPQVSRFLETAVKARFLGTAPAYNDAKISPEDKEAVEEKYFANESLRKLLARHVPKGIRFEVREFTGAEGQFTRTAAGRVLQLLRHSKMIGLMSGKTIYHLVEGIKFLTKSSNAQFSDSIKCIPLCGDPIHLMNLRQVNYSASHLAASVMECITGKPPTDLPCLTGVPAYVSPSLQNEGFKEFLKSIPGYHHIFGKQNEGEDGPLVESIDTIITGIGVVSTGRYSASLTSAFIRERIEQHEESEINLNKIVLGDIGGLLIERNESDKKRVAELNEGWIGIKERHFQRVTKASGKNGPGVIVIAFGEEKAKMVFEIIKRGLVNELIIQTDLSKNLQALAKRKI
jgi:DNA-binding transcriptional regulator LsrR (DeoR family)